MWMISTCYVLPLDRGIYLHRTKGISYIIYKKDFFIRTFSSLYYIFNKTFYLAKRLERLAVNAKRNKMFASISVFASEAETRAHPSVDTP